MVQLVRRVGAKVTTHKLSSLMTTMMGHAFESAVEGLAGQQAGEQPEEQRDGVVGAYWMSVSSPKDSRWVQAASGLVE
jgi:hypothetical protein